MRCRRSAAALAAGTARADRRGCRMGAMPAVDVDGAIVEDCGKTPADGPRPVEDCRNSACGNIYLTAGRAVPQPCVCDRDRLRRSVVAARVRETGSQDHTATVLVVFPAREKIIYRCHVENPRDGVELRLISSNRRYRIVPLKELRTGGHDRGRGGWCIGPAFDA